jgi:dCTP diphosphatase
MNYSSSDLDTTVAELKAAMATFAKERDWEQFHAAKNLSMAIAAEAGELLEHFLWVKADESDKMLSTGDKKEKVAEELADIVLFVLQFSNMTGIDLSSAVRAKLAHNSAKYPVEKAKGRSEKYTEL